MDQPTDGLDQKSSVRQRILFSVIALILISLLGSGLSLYRMAEVSQMLDAMNRTSVPLSRVFAQTLSDAGVLKSELDRSLGASHWKDPKWHPRSAPKWIDDLIVAELKRLGELFDKYTLWADDSESQRWRDWIAERTKQYTEIQVGARELATLLEKKEETQAALAYPKWISKLENWQRQLEWGSSEYERTLRKSFSVAEARTRELRTGLELILFVVVTLSLLLFWLGERALRPLGELTRLARDITRRGLRPEDKSLLPNIRLTRSDEVSQLAREFHNMATSLLEREKTVEEQKKRLMEQNALLREIGSLNENILSSIKSALIVVDTDGRVKACNPAAVKFLTPPDAEVKMMASAIVGTTLFHWEPLRKLFGQKESQQDIARAEVVRRIEPTPIHERMIAGQVYPLSGSTTGAVIVIEDLTDDFALQERLKSAEHLAAIGRLSAQVAHEVRNPLHSLGLETEIALDLAQKIGNKDIRQSLQSIMQSVDRLEKITDNYLKFSRLSQGKNGAVDIADVLQSVLATYANQFEANSIKMDWRLDPPQGRFLVWGDGEMLEQALGNLVRNAIQAVEETRGTKSPQIGVRLWITENQKIWFEIEDSGPGIAPENQHRLFTPFMTTKAQGTGLGLSLVKKVVDDHGGSIQLVDAPRARFRIWLPELPEAPKSKETRLVSFESTMEGMHS